MSPHHTNRILPYATLIVALAATTGACGGSDAANTTTQTPLTSTTAAHWSHTDHVDPLHHDIAAETIEEPEQPHLVDARVEAEAADLRREVERAASEQPWRDEAGAAAAGYVQMPGDPLHWYHPTVVGAGGPIDPERPDFLMIDDGQVLGVMFITPSDDGSTDPPPAPGSPLVRWHLHRWSDPVCLGVGGLVVQGIPADDGTCPTGQVAATNSPWMFHVWLVGDDPFAAEMHPDGHGG